MANPSLAKEIDDIISSIGTDCSDSDIPELVHVALDCAYDGKYDKSFVDSYLGGEPRFPISPPTIGRLNNEKTQAVGECEVSASKKVGGVMGNLGSPLGSPHPAKLAELESRSFNDDQRTEGWLKRRHDFITGSIVAHAIGLMGPAARHNLLLEKASYGEYRSFNGGYHTHYGNRYEPVSNAIYSYRTGRKINMFGLIPHDKVEFLGASTDGVTDNIRNIEIKSLSSRTINGKIKKEYYHQMQMQMECLGLPVTDFIETSCSEFANKEEFDTAFVLTKSKKTPEKGCMIEIYNSAAAALEYIYSPMEYCQDLTAMNQWIFEQNEIIAMREDVVFVREIYWKLDVYSCIEVKKEKGWLATYQPKLEEFWHEVQLLRQDPEKLKELIEVKTKKPSSMDVICMS